MSGSVAALMLVRNPGSLVSSITKAVSGNESGYNQPTGLGSVTTAQFTDGRYTLATFEDNTASNLIILRIFDSSILLGKFSIGGILCNARSFDPNTGCTFFASAGGALSTAQWQWSNSGVPVIPAGATAFSVW